MPELWCRTAQYTTRLKSLTRATALHDDQASHLMMLPFLNNFVKPHMALEGKTPAQAVGLQVAGNNKWLSLKTQK